MDLTQAEAIGDLIDAETEGQRRQAGRLYQGEAARVFEGWRGLLVSAMAALEASIDFPDEADIPGEINLTALEPIEALAVDLEAALGDAGRLASVRDGFRIAILGPPNAGKSSLMNRLARREAAIVSPIAGTTRDVVEVRLVLAGYPVWVADTAGLREAADALEAEGIRRALTRAEEADLRIWVSDASDVSRETSSTFREGDLRALNKADLLNGDSPPLAGSEDVFVVSARTGAGLDPLERRLTQIVRDRLETDEAPPCDPRPPPGTGRRSTRRRRTWAGGGPHRDRGGTGVGRPQTGRPGPGADHRVHRRRGSAGGDLFPVLRGEIGRGARASWFDRLTMRRCRTGRG
jgi:tRNA modification GTPase